MRENYPDFLCIKCNAHICCLYFITSNPRILHKYFCLLLQVEVLGLVSFIYPSSGLLPWQEPGKQISRTEGSYPGLPESMPVVLRHDSYRICRSLLLHLVHLLPKHWFSTQAGAQESWTLPEFAARLMKPNLRVVLLSLTSSWNPGTIRRSHAVWRLQMCWLAAMSIQFACRLLVQEVHGQRRLEMSV
jgi:hypothetical protein